mmetsp:Transcript_5113/g.9393  ORF Transcript_5113/g.9393 Transcript_5113/m.9393 type:complete len:119 (+) Transcript_5113:59-415(+)
MSDSERSPHASFLDATGKKAADEPGSVNNDDDDSKALLVGKQILAISAILEDPNTPNALNTVVELGTDSRYYVLCRGWLNEMLRLDQSILDARSDDPSPKISSRVDFLKKAIRAIDLE